MGQSRRKALVRYGSEADSAIQRHDRPEYFDQAQHGLA